MVKICRFLAPEALSSNWSTKSDVWAAGVMAYQLLTGRLPFNDKRNPHNPVLSAVLRSILTEPLNFSKAYWQDISDDAKDFVQFMLNRDPEERPTAVEALNHPWLLGDVCDRKKGKQMPLNVVQRIQRFGRIDVLQRSLLELIAAELAEDDMAPVRV
jgi:calcium-dependent protein kinase